MDSHMPSSSRQKGSTGMDQPPQLIPFTGNPSNQKENAPILEPFYGTPRPNSAQVAPGALARRLYHLERSSNSPKFVSTTPVSHQEPLRTFLDARRPDSMDASIDRAIDSVARRKIRKVPGQPRRRVAQSEDPFQTPQFRYAVHQLPVQMHHRTPPGQPSAQKKKRGPGRKKQQAMEPTEFYPEFQQDYLDYPEYQSEEFQKQYVESERFHPINQEVYEKEPFVLYPLKPYQPYTHLPDIEPILDELLSKGPVLDEKFLKREQNEFCWMLGLPPMHKLN